MTTILSARNVTKAFGDSTVLHGISVDIAAGDMVAITGPSGSGKSTLLYALSGMDSVTSGHVTLCGEDLTQLSQKELARLRLTHMGFVFQQIHLLTNLNVLDNIIFPAFLAGLAPRDELVERAHELMQNLGVESLARRDITEASGGQLQRVGICRALINEPRIIFADEPTGALDSENSRQVMDIFRDINAAGTTIVMVTHDEDIASSSPRRVHLVDGLVDYDTRAEEQ